MPRDGSGNYTLPGPNPYPAVTATVISSSAFNTMLADLQAAMTDSLDRSGLGGMLAPFGFLDGTKSAPGATFASESSSGLYRAGTGDVEMSILGATVTRWTSANLFQVSPDNGVTWGQPLIGGITNPTITGTFNFTGTFEIGGQTLSTPASAACKNTGTATSFTNNTQTLLVFPSTVEDNLTGVTTGPPWKYTVQTGAMGNYLVTVGAYMSLTGANNTQLLMEVLKNGNAVGSVRDFLVTGCNFAAVHISCILPSLVATDIITVRCTQTSGSTGTLILGDPAANFIQIAKVAS